MFTLIGERINATRPSIQAAVEKRDVQAIRVEAIKQTEAGADYLDINAGGRPGQIGRDMAWLVEVVQEAVSKPLCLDSPDPLLLQEAYGLIKQRPMINSISLESNRFQPMLSFLKGRDCSIIGLCLDDQGIPGSVEDVIDRAGALVKGLEDIGFDRDSIHIDPLIQPVAVNTRAGITAVEAMQGILQKFPGVHITCGLSNFSYGLPLRRAINRVLLPVLMTAGLDGAIVDPLDEKFMSTLVISKMVLGQDRFCRQYTQAAKAGRIL
ncbi:MAG: dihydropteroate synthase [Deltaproteobacteria bacterium]|nr:dihydropteroate synthase [Deltaproteobacteria bacterium]